MNEIKIPYQHSVVRDLAWVMLSPGLLQTAPEGQAIITDEMCRQIYAVHTDHLHALDKNPEPLLHMLSKSKSHRLGIYFEWLLRYWLEAILQVSQLGHNVPVFKIQKTGGKQTLGEFDFLFRAGEKQSLQQWEATVKFYLQKIDEQGQSYWIGPGGHDRLDVKLNRLFKHQLKLAELPEAKACLIEMGGEPIESAGFIKGYLFYPLAADHTIPPHSDDDATLSLFSLSSMHNKGWWFQWGERSFPVSSMAARWVILAKPRWLSPALYKQGDELLLDVGGIAAYCEDYFREQVRPLLVAELHWESGAWQELSRGFVLPPP